MSPNRQWPCDYYVGRAELWRLTPRILASSRLCWRQHIGFTNEDTYFTQPIVRSAHGRRNKWPLTKAWFLQKLQLATTIVIYYMYKGLLLYIYMYVLPSVASAEASSSWFRLCGASQTLVCLLLLTFCRLSPFLLTCTRMLCSESFCRSHLHFSKEGHWCNPL